MNPRIQSSYGPYIITVLAIHALIYTRRVIRGEAAKPIPCAWVSEYYLCYFIYYSYYYHYCYFYFLFFWGGGLGLRVPNYCCSSI